MPAYRAVITLVLLSGLDAAWPSAARGDELDQQIDDRLADMTTGGSAYNPKELHALGLAGLERLLDRLFPETAPAPKEAAPPPDDEARRLVAQLGDEEFRLREAATEQLIAKGKPFRDLLLKAAGSDDAEVRLRAQRILAAWTPREGGLVEQALGGFWKYAESIRDRERLQALARRTAAVLDRGWPEGSKVHLTRLCIAGVAKGGDDDACELLRPLLAHKDVRVAKLLVETIGSYRDKSFFPSILTAALASQREEVAEAAVRWCQNCGDAAQAAEIRRALRSVFAGPSDAMKFQSSLALTQEFDDPQAWLYLVEQTLSKEPLRAASAQSRLAGLAWSGKPAGRELVEKLEPLLRSPGLAARFGAAKALSIHAGRDVVECLLPLLADKEQSIADVARRGMLDQPDKSLVQKLLTAAAAGHADAAIRAAAGQLLSKLEAH